MQYGLAIFEQDAPSASAYGNFTHVFVDRQTEKPVPIPESIRAKLAQLTE